MREEGGKVGDFNGFVHLHTFVGLVDLTLHTHFLHLSLYHQKYKQ
jgi:hypothetical protein